MRSSYSENPWLSLLGFYPPWLLWIILTTSWGLIPAAAFYEHEVTGWTLATLFGGLIIGILQGIALHKRLTKGKLLWWTLWNWAGMFGASIVLWIAALITLIGSGLNDVDYPSLVKGLSIFCAFAGFVFGALQPIKLPVPNANPFLWTAVTTAAWGVGGFFGNYAGAQVFLAEGNPRFDSPDGRFAVAVGIFAGIAVMSILTGFYLRYLLREPVVSS